MQSNFCVIKRILLERTEAVLYFKAHIVDNCAPFGFGKKLCWFFVQDLLNYLAMTSPNNLVSKEVYENFIDMSSIFHNESCTASTLAAIYQKSLTALLTHPCLDQIGSHEVETLFSHCHTTVQSPEFKKLSIPGTSPALWSAQKLIEILRLRSKETARQRLRRIEYRQKALKQKQDQLDKLLET